MYCSVILYGNFKCGKNTELLVRININDLSEKTLKFLKQNQVANKQKN